MANLNPAIDTLGLGAPYLGPWFDDPALTLAAPDISHTSGDLAVLLTLSQAVTHWLPPAAGMLSLLVSTAVRPPMLARLRRPDGSPAFYDDRLIALFTLLPEVADRLDALTRHIPAADGIAVGVLPTSPSRARVASLALEFGDNLAGRLAQLMPTPPVGQSAADTALHFGLKLSSDGLSLDNDPRPMCDLRRPGQVPVVGATEPLIALWPADSGAVRLHAFDSRGRPLDPGAVAAWWADLARQYPDLWAAGLSLPMGIGANDERTAPVAPALTLQLVNAHEGPVQAALRARIDLAALGLLDIDLDLLATRPSGQATVGFLPKPGAAADPDDAPVPRCAALPSGRYAAQTALWATAASTPLARDFVRVAVVELESHLVGQRRVPPDQPTPEQTWRADNQQRVTTRVNIAQSLGPALLATVDEAAAAALAVVGAGATQLVAGAVDTDWGCLAEPIQPPFTLPNLLAWPTGNPPVLLLPLRGGDANPNLTPALGQRVLLVVKLVQAPPGGWVRVWPVGFDLASGERRAMTGGAGLIDNTGQAVLVLELPDGAGTDPLAFRWACSAPGGSTRNFGEVRLPRPKPAGGGSAGVTWPAGGSVVLCEQPLTLIAGQVASLSILSGTTIVAQGSGGWDLIDPSTVPVALRAVDTLAGRLNASVAPHRIELTQPAFKAMPQGTVGLVGNAWLGAGLRRAARCGLSPVLDASQPLASQERLDHAVASTTAARACVWTAPALSRYHELGAHSAGHPYAPAAVEVHGTGVALNGPAAFLVAEHTSERIAHEGFNLVTAALAMPTPPAPAAGANIWAAVLKTVAAGVEGDRDFGQEVRSPNDASKAYVFGPVTAGGPARPYAVIQQWYDAAFVTKGPMGINISGTSLQDIAAVQSPAAERAMDRRALAAGWGQREAMTSIAAAFARAEDLVYIETPALDITTIGPAMDVLLAPLLQRLIDRPQLRVLVCLPHRLMPGWPRSVELTRNQNLIDTLGALFQGKPVPNNLFEMFAGDRVVVFSPSAGQGRALRLSSTTVIVDDAYALTGSTHLWRRGLSFDGSLAVAVFDEQLAMGRPAEIVAFRRRLIARALSLPSQPTVSVADLRVPDDPVALLEAVRQYNQAGSPRIGQAPLALPELGADPGSGFTPNDGWNPDGSWRPDADVLSLLHSFLVSQQGELA